MAETRMSSVCQAPGEHSFLLSWIRNAFQRFGFPLSRQASARMQNKCTALCLASHKEHSPYIDCTSSRRGQRRDILEHLGAEGTLANQLACWPQHQASPAHFSMDL
ncbi:unnamed protein product [Lota lota]